MDWEDVGGYYAERDYIAETCEENYGHCDECPIREECEDVKIK